MKNVIDLTKTPAVRQWRISFKIGRRARTVRSWDQFTHEGAEFEAERFAARTSEAFLVTPADVIVLGVQEMV